MAVVIFGVLLHTNRQELGCAQPWTSRRGLSGSVVHSESSMQDSNGNESLSDPITDTVTLGGPQTGNPSPPLPATPPSPRNHEGLIEELEITG